LKSILNTYATQAPATQAPISDSSCANAWCGNKTHYVIGQCVSFNGQIYAVLQAHTSQSDWAPSVAISLFLKSPLCCSPRATYAPATSAPATCAPTSAATYAPHHLNSVGATTAPATCATSAPATYAPATTSAPITTYGSDSSCAVAWNANKINYVIGQCVSFNGQIYKVLQAHTSQASWTPTLAASLFLLSANCCLATQAPATYAPITQAPATCAPVTQAPATYAPVTQAPAYGCAGSWNANKINYVLGQCVAFNGQIYAVLQNHTSQSTWTPLLAASLFLLSPNCCSPTQAPATYAPATQAPATCAPTVPVTYAPTSGSYGCAVAWNGNSVAFHVGQCVYFNGEIFKVLASHTSQTTWTPSIAASLFLLSPACCTPTQAPSTCATTVAPATCSYHPSSYLRSYYTSSRMCFRIWIGC